MMLAAVLAGFAFALIAPWLSRWLGRAGPYLLALVPLGMFCYFLSLAGQISHEQTITQVTTWAPQLGADVALHLDGLSLMFALLITGIGTLIVLYAGSYLQGHPSETRFYPWLLTFMSAMLGLVLADNIFVLFVFWELTSISSYFLIGFEHERETARKSALQALLVTGTGGMCLLAGLVLLSIITGATTLSEMVPMADAIQSHSLFLPTMALIVLGAATKSAQFPFHFWLPNAMEAPTPVSAYLHSSTMVKAGVYLLARMTPILGGGATWATTLTILGGVTMVVGAFLAVQQSYLKKLLAYSTISALGVLVFLLGLHGQVVGDEKLATYAAKAFAVFLLAHAFYKATLFLVAGSITHETGEKDATKVGGLARAMPMTAVAAVLAGLSMAGVPPLFGFIGKEYLLEVALGQPSLMALLVAAAASTGLLFVVVAMLVVVGPFFGAKKETPKPAHETPWIMWLGPLLLGIGGLAMGVLPALLAQPIVKPVVTSILGHAPKEEVHLKLWHGLNPALGLSLLALLGGLAWYFLHTRIMVGLSKLNTLYAYGPEQWYTWFYDGTLAYGAWQTRRVQTGFMRDYLSVTVATTVGLVTWGLFRLGTLPPMPAMDDLVGGQIGSFKLIKFYEPAGALIILLGLAGMLFFTSRLVRIAHLGLVGLGVALIYVFYGAPDLAITQFIVETLTVVLFVLVFYHLPDSTSLSSRTTIIRDAVLCGSAGLMMTFLVLIILGTEGSPTISEWFAEQSVPAGHGRNIVNVILVDFRAMDTLGEIVVLAVAAVGVYALLKGGKQEGDGSGAEESAPQQADATNTNTDSAEGKA